MQVREVGDGNINFVYIVEGPAGVLCVKQGPPFVRVMQSWALGQVRRALSPVREAGAALRARHAVVGPGAGAPRPKPCASAEYHTYRMRLWPGRIARPSDSQLVPAAFLASGLGLGFKGVLMGFR